MSHNISYNTTYNRLIFKEYGRNVQRLVEYAITLEDRNHRNQVAKAIITLMGQMHPHLRNVEEFRHKLWDQLHALSNFELDIDSPYPIPKFEDVYLQPVDLPYPQTRIRYKHYGKNVENLINKAVTMQDEAKRLSFARVIAGYMKMVYRSWNRDGLSDEIIKNDLSTLSGGVLDLSDEQYLQSNKSSRKKKRSSKGSTSGRNSHKKRNYK